MAYGFVLIKTEPGKERSVIINLLRLKVSRNIHTVFGEYDVVMVLQDKDFNALGQTVIDKVRGLPGVEDTMTLASCRLQDMNYGGLSKGL